ncbi:serine/arginine-rich splicing factor RS31-like [Hibiscus syriacus]|uniref:serine/arginine-rich splicing factor RS31-like n=1 Tax=Hibiscus syriacus TaxID=106335 RepID=UPI001920D6E7|nr:serine/arginine-rich splicing factor RS31-like [Hibiscus syriacus]
MGSPTSCKIFPACLSVYSPATHGWHQHAFSSLDYVTHHPHRLHHLDLLHHSTLLHPYVHQPFLHIHAGFAFVYFEDERDAEDAIRGLDNIPFGYDHRRLSVEWAKGVRGRHRDGSKSTTNQRPTKTLFVINFDPIRTRERDITKHFEPYGKVLNVRIRRNFAFVQFATQEDASKALEATQRSKLLDRVVSVEYAFKG